MNEQTKSNSWIDPDDAPKLTRNWFERAELRDGNRLVRRGRSHLEAPNQAGSLRLDPDVVAVPANWGGMADTDK